MRVVLGVALVGLIVCVGCRPGPTPDTVIAAIKELGGEVKIDENGTVVGVGFYEGNKVTDNDLVFLKGLKKLEEMELNHTRVTDAGLVHLKELPKLERLWLSGTKVTDDGLVHLEGMSKLEMLSLSGTWVTDAGVNQLQQALPNCVIWHSAPFETDVRLESTELQYQLDLSMIKGVAGSEVARQARDIISSRLESNRIKEVRIAVEGKDRLRVTIPAGVGAPTLFIEELVSRVGHLQLQLVAGLPEHTARIPEYRKATEKWEADFKAHVKLHDAWEAGGKTGEEPPEPPEPEYIVCPEMEKNDETGHWVERGLLVLSNIPRDVVDGDQIKSASVSIDPQTSMDMVVFSLDEGEEGTGKLRKITSDNIGKRLAIVMDGQVILAPSIRGQITTNGQISGDFTRQEVSSIATFLSGGRLPAEMTLVSRKVTSPKPGLPAPDSGK